MSSLHISGCGSSSVPARLDAIAELEGRAYDGAYVYAISCRLCHDPEEEDSVSLETLMTDMELGELILRGQGKMPPLRESLSNQDIADVIAYLREGDTTQ